MRLVLLFLTLPSFYPAVLAQAPPPGQPFYLKVVGGNTLINGAVLRNNNTYDFGVTPPPYYNSPPYGDHPIPISISTTNTSELLISPTNPHPGPVRARLALVSDGAGDWILAKAIPQSGGLWNVGPGRDNAVVKVVGWEFKAAIWGGATVLRWADATSSGRWIAVKSTVTPSDGAPYAKWVVHWFEGSVVRNAKVLSMLLTTFV